MRKILPSIIAFLILVGAASALPQQPKPAESDKKLVNITADYSHSIQLGDSSAMYLVGNVVLYHNGAVLTCDSAVRYNNRHMEFFTRVVINKDSTYVYGDRADYNGELNLARIYSPLIKMVDGEGVLYTYNFTFNTLDNIGEYYGGGTMQHGDNLLESERGYYHTDTRDFICVENVRISNPDYKMTSDSVVYNMGTEVARFFTRTYVWSQQGEFLTATKGEYFNAEQTYNFTENSYVLTENREVWADSIWFNSVTEDAVLRNNIQLRDEEQKVIAFGDYGQWWGQTEEALLTKNPSLMTFDPEQDSLYMRADSMFMYSIPHELDYGEYEIARREGKVDSLIRAAREVPVSATIDTLAGADIVFPDSIDTLEIDADSLGLSNAWPVGFSDSEQAATLSDLERIVVMEKAEQFMLGDTLRRDMINSQLYNRMLRHGMSDEDIEGQLLYNERLAEARERGEEEMSIDVVIDILREVGILLPANEVDENNTFVPGESATGEDETGEYVNDGQDAETDDGSDEENIPERDGQAPCAGSDPAPVNQCHYYDVCQPLAFGNTRNPARGSGHGVEPGKYRYPYLFTAQDSTEINAPDSTARDGYYDDPAQRRIPNDSIGDVASDSLSLPFQEDSVGMSPATPDSLAVAAAQETLIPTDSVETQQDSLQRIVRAYRDVRIFRNDFQAVCDSMIGFSKDSTLHMHIKPVLWNETNQITSEVIDIYSKNEEVERAVFTGNPIMSSEVELGTYNQVKGKTMEAFFRESKIYRNDVKTDAHTLYYSMDDDADAPNGLLDLTSDNITFLIEDNELIRITPRLNINWTLYPINDIPLSLSRFMEGFTWESARRPTLEMVFNRTVRSSEREKYESMEQPAFLLTEKIQKHKEEMISNRQWVDRNDTLSPTALEFIHEIENR